VLGERGVLGVLGERGVRGERGMLGVRGERGVLGSGSTQIQYSVYSLVFRQSLQIGSDLFCHASLAAIIPLI